MIKNSIYLSAPEVFTATIEDCSGTIQHTKKLNDFQTAQDWSIGMIKDNEGHAFKVMDTDTKKVLSSGRFIMGQVMPYEAKSVPVESLSPVQAEMSKGTEVELEHRTLITEMLVLAGYIPTESKIKAVAREIARVHVDEDPSYYEKLERVGL